MGRETTERLRSDFQNAQYKWMMLFQHMLYQQHAALHFF